MELELVRFAVFSSFLVAASLQDLRSRYISDLIWISAAGLLIPLLIFEMVDGTFNPLPLIIAVAIAAAITIPLNRIGYLGTADVFALLLLSVYTPSIDIGTSVPLTPIVVTIVASVLSLATLCINLLRNIAMLVRGENIFVGFEQESLARKVVAVMMGYRTEQARGHCFSMEKLYNGQRRFEFRAKSSAEFANGSDMWVTQALPFIVYITIAYMATFFAVEFDTLNHIPSILVLDKSILE
jgi:Flp pilus assembly protein protease CpaA